MLARQIAIGFGIAIIFPLLVYYGVATFYPAPNRQPLVTTVAPGPNASPEERRECADQQRKQQEAFNAATKEFARVHVLVSVLLGVAAILIGAYLTLHAISTGLIFGGIFTIVWGSWSFWQYVEDWVRFLSLLTGFAILLFLGYRRVLGGRSSSGVP